MASRKRSRVKARVRPAARHVSSTAIVPAQQALSIPEAIEKVLIVGDLSALTPSDRVDYYKRVCNSLGLNPLTMPFSYILFRESDGGPAKLSLYANKSCTEQLRKIHGVSVVPPLRRSRNADIVTVEADVRDRMGRTDSASGSVALFKYKDGKRIDLTGKDLCNAEMKCETKAKRRATLSICGLAFLDESELDTMQVLGGVTPEGRIYYHEGAEEARNGSREAAQRVLSEKLASRNPNALEPENASHSRPASQEPPPQAVPKAQIPPREWRGTVEIDWSVDSAFPRVTGDIAEVAAHFPPDLVLKRRDDFWHAFKEDVPRIKAACEKEGFRVSEIFPKSSAPRVMPPSEKTTARRGSGGTGESGTATPAVVKGTVERVFSTMTQNKAPMRQITILLADGKKPTFGVFDKDLFDYLDKAKGAIECYVTTSGKYSNLVGLKHLVTTKGVIDFDSDGKTPCIQVNREPGRTLF